MKMMIYEVELNNGECVFSNKRDECIDKINYIIEKNKYNYVKKITLAVLDRLINIKDMTNPVIKKASKTQIQDYYKDDIKYFIENDKKTRTDKALEKVISRLVIKLYSIQEANIHTDYDLYVKEQKRLQNENTEIKTSEHKDNKIIDSEIQHTDDKIIDSEIHDKDNKIIDSEIQHTDDKIIDSEIHDKDNKIIDSEIHDKDNNNELVKSISEVDNNEIEPNNNELVKSINEVDNNFNEIDTKQDIDTINNEIDTINNAVDDIDTTNNNIEPNNNEIDTNNNIEPKQDNNNELVKSINEVDNIDDTITEINDIYNTNNEINQNDDINTNNDIEKTTHYFNPKINSEPYNQRKLIKRYGNTNNKKTLAINRFEMKKRNKTIKHNKISKKNEQELHRIHKIMKKYGTLEKLIKSINECITISELEFITKLYKDLYETECNETLNIAVYNQILEQDERINNVKNILPNRTLLHTF
jgi:hypothetical protein